jgi:NTE family protein
VCALRLDDGERVVFGAAGAVTATVGEAVGASCAIPGWFAPVRIGGARYVDGGAYSLANLDTVAGADLEVVIVSSPMSAVPAAARSVDGAVRAAAHLQLGRESARVRAHGTKVIAIEPDAADLSVMGNVSSAMDRARRAAVTRHVRDAMAERLRRSGVIDLLRSGGR